MEDRFERFTTLILRLNRQIQHIKSAEMARMGLKGIHASCLFLLLKADTGMTQTDLTRACAEDKASVSRAMSILMDMDLVTDGHTGGKRYRHALRLTPRGREVALTVAGRVEAALENAKGTLSEADRDIMYRCMETIAGNLDEYIPELQNGGNEA